MAETAPHNFFNPSLSEEGKNFVVVQGALGSCKICSSRAPGGQMMHRIILVRTIKITFQKVLNNFAFIKKLRYFMTQMCVCASQLQSQITLDMIWDGSQIFRARLTPCK